ARGGNSGLQDADNLAWKLAAVVRGEADERLLDSYDAERLPATDENLLNSTRSTDFMTPKSNVSRAFRDAVLELARDHPFARRLVNSGRLSLPGRYENSPLNTPDLASFATGPAPGSPAVDAPLDNGWLLDQLATNRFTLLCFGDNETRDSMADIATVQVQDLSSTAARRYDAQAGTTYLFRPDQHVAARWRSMDEGAVREAQARALAHR
ncbi:MAG: FAD-dependent monooxygenase, partial [Alphaproteobacteria bacterium]|nr:FAD-dependent monooxygenase [Alphaproteobacteria bacterium]